MSYRIGYSRDVHRFAKGRTLILGGVIIDYPRGLAGHSDADCVLHTVAEAIIGALALGDLGMHFPDNDPAYKDKSSGYFVEKARESLISHSYMICNVDITIIIEEPLLSPYLKLMKINIARLLRVSENNINVKATRNEGLGFIGRKEGVASECAVLIKKEGPVKKYL